MYLHTFLTGLYGQEIACYSGRGGEAWDGGQWIPVSREQLTESLDRGQVSIRLCTDATSEGLNLQAASTLVNYDLPWNPMRVEQRIGRIDRIRQKAADLPILNYVMRDTIEDRVYEVLAERIRIFEGAVGDTQSILGQLEAVITESSPEDLMPNLEDLAQSREREGRMVGAALQ